MGVVLLFHVWPSAMPGGYVGVDVFFVISGYLIVGSLVREAEREGRISLLNFYRRRVRRLLPAASLVLACVFAATFLLLPPPRWSDTLLQVAASALYVENWYLSWSAVDYLAAENAASPVQHYWSLSIEEQFYIVWPLLMVLATGIGKVITKQIKAAGTTDDDGVFSLPNVPVDPVKVPALPTGDVLRENPFGYVAVIGNNGLLHLRVEYQGSVDYAWFDITEANVAYYQGQTDRAVFERRLPLGGPIQRFPPSDLAEIIDG